MHLQARLLLDLVLCCAAAVAPSAGADDLLAVGTSGDIFILDSQSGQGRLLDGARHFTGLNCLGKNATGVMYSASGTTLITVDEVTGQTSRLATMDINDVRGLAFAPDGSLYAIDDGGIATPDVLYSVDPASGAAVLIGSTSHARVQGFAIDNDGRAFAWDTDSGLLLVNLDNGETTDVNGLPDGTRDINSLTFSAEGDLFGCRYIFFSIDSASGAWSMIGSGGYTDVRGLAFIGAANGRVLTVSGRCPGVLTVQWRGAMPDRPAALVIGAARGEFIIPRGLPCGGSVLGMTGQVRLADPPGVFSTGSGSGSFTGTLGTGACGRFLQFIESGSCEVSNVALIR